MAEKEQYYGGGGEIDYCLLKRIQMTMMIFVGRSATSYVNNPIILMGTVLIIIIS